MAELEVDQSHLPRVQEVSQYFSVLEDGALAHNLQEQEIEQYYSSNVQRNQLVQKDIRVAKRLQDEEHQRAQMLNQQAIRQLEEQDSEYARRIQEEIQCAAEEERKREEKDEEIAKRIQEEEEELYVRQRNSCRRTDDRVSSNTMGSPNTLQPSRPLFSEEEELAWRSRMHSPSPSMGSPNTLQPSRPLFSEGEELAWRSRMHSPSPSTSDSEEDQYEIRRPSNREYRDNVEQRHRPVREVPLRRRSTQSRSSFASQSSTALGGWGDVVQLIKNDLIEQGYLSCSSEDEIFEPVYKLERILSQRQQAPEWRGNQEKRLSHRSSMREGNRQRWQGDGGSRVERYRHLNYKDSRIMRSESRLARRYSSSDYKSGDVQRRVHFQDDQQPHNLYIDGRRALVRTHGGERELRSCSVRPYQCNVQVDRSVPPLGEESRAYRHEAGGVRNSFSQEIREEAEDHGRLRERRRWEGGNGVRPEHRPRARSLREEWRQEERVSRQYRGEPSRRRIRSERWQGNQEDMSSTDEEEVDRERERRRLETRIPRYPQRSLSVSCRGRSPGPGQRVNRPPLDLRELRQVLQDEELARRLQAEEEELLRGDLTPPSSYPKGDFTVAQVAQDEEIAHYIQKQELQAEQSQELEDYDSGRGYRETGHVYDSREVYDGQIPRDRLDSEGLMSPGDECSAEQQPSSPVTLAGQQHPFRNIAEELDPTFHKQESVQAGPSVPDIQTTPQTGSCEDAAIVTPTKRQNDKLGRTKSKVKKENSKTKENCKQQ